jgi:peptidyl-prolyl cis-trans isomerase B (cyclophilin B)
MTSRRPPARLLAAASAAGAFAMALCWPAAAQNAGIQPERLYYGVDRAIPMTVHANDGEPVRIDLFPAGGDEPVASAEAVPGKVDLAGLFPILWEQRDSRVMYAQLVVGDERLGAPVVLQPMLSPDRAVLLDPSSGYQTFHPQGAVMFRDELIRFLERLPPDDPRRAGVAPHRPVYSGLRAYVDKHVVLETSHGRIAFRLRPDQAPNTAWNFRHLVEGGFYTDVIFHRIVPSVTTDQGPHPFVIQGGDPRGIGDGGPGYMVDLEPSRLPHDFGVLSMARSSEPNTNGSQFFICLSREGTSFLDSRYTAFGQAVGGADTILQIAAVELEEGQGQRPGERPKDPPVITQAVLVDAPPFGTGSEPVRRPEPAGDR